MEKDGNNQKGCIMKRLTYSGIIVLVLVITNTMVLLLSLISCARSKNPEWMNFTSGKNIQSLVDDGDYLWVGADGLTRLNKFTGEKTFYTRLNSGLPTNGILSLTVNSEGSKWIGTEGGGLAKFNGVNWTLYDTSNSGLPSNNVFALAIDNNGNKWIGTKGGGLAVYREGGVILK
jgi:ligand-binding sensor domain-containing protein